MPRTHHLATAALLAAALATASHAQTAYFSIEGEITAELGQHNIFFDLTRPVSTSEELRFETWGSAGGFNAAGNFINASSVDSFLEFFDSDNAIGASNDDGAVGPTRNLDSLLSWPGVAESGGTLPATGLPAALANRLKFRDFADNSTGTWAVDLVGPADALQLLTLVPDAANPGGVSVVDRISIGTDVQGGTPATWNWISFATLEVQDTIVVAPTGNAVLNIPLGRINAGILGLDVKEGGTVNIQGGTLGGESPSVRGQMNLTAGSIETPGIFLFDGELKIDGGTLNLGGLGVRVVGGQMTVNTPFTVSSNSRIRATGSNSTVTFNDNVTVSSDLIIETNANLSLAPNTNLHMTGGLFRHEDQLILANGKSITMDSSSARIEMPSGLRFDTATLEVDAGTVDLEDSLFQVGIFENSTATFSGPDSKLVNARTRIGFGGGTGTLTFDNNATGNTLRDVEINLFDNDGNTGRLVVLSGSEVTTNNVFLGTGFSNSTSKITVDDATFNQSAGASLTIGAAGASGTATLDLDNNANFNTGHQGATVHTNGLITIDASSKLLVNGPIDLIGGRLTAAGFQSLDLAGNITVTASQNASLEFNTSYAFGGNNTVNITDGSTWNIDNFLDVANSIGDATLNILGSNSRVVTNLTSPTRADWGLSGSTANVTIADSGSLKVNATSLNLSNSFLPGVVNLRLETAGSLIASDVNINEGATVQLDFGTTFTSLGSISLNPNGSIIGSGTIDVLSGLTNNGTLDPQSLSTYNGLEELTLFGSYTQTATGVIRFDTIDGDATLLDAIGINGVATLAGELAFVSNDPLLDFGLLPLYSHDPLGGLFFNTENAYTGIFRITGNLLGDGTGLAVIYNEDSIDIFRGLVGDTDGSQVIDLIDLSTLASNFGSSTATWNMGDFNGDNTIDLIDLSLLASNFGESAPSIPEPASAALVLLLAACLRRPDQQQFGQ